MSEHEKKEQVGALAEEYSRLKGELNHVEEKIRRSLMACQALGQFAQNQNALSVSGDKIILINRAPTQVQIEVSDLLGFHELRAQLIDRTKLREELGECGKRLGSLVPHLLPHQ